MAVPKRKRSHSKQGRHRSSAENKAQMPQLTTLSNGVRVPSHMVTALNPIYKGVKFLSPKKDKQK